MPSRGLFLTRQFYSFLPHLAMGIKKLYPHRGYLILHGIEILTVHTHCDAPLPVGYCLQKSCQRRTLQVIYGNITTYRNITINSVKQRPDNKAHPTTCQGLINQALSTQSRHAGIVICIQKAWS